MYKFADESGLAVENLDTLAIFVEPSLEWDAYEVWLSQGNVTEAYRTQEELDTLESVAQRVADIEQELAVDNLESKTVAEAHQWIDDRFINAETAGEKLDVIILILKKIVTHLLR